MQALTIHAPRQRLLKPLIVALAAASSCAAWADDEHSPFYIGGKQTFLRDSNVFRTPDAVHDYYSITGLLGGFDQKISRQRVYATANVEANKYHNNTVLDNTSYGVNAGWDWETIESLTGTFNVNANQNLATFNGNANQPLNNERNLVKTDQVSTSIRWGGQGILTLEGNYAHSRVRYSAPEFLVNESSADTASIGGYYRAGAFLKLGVAVRGTRTESPYAVPKTGAPVGSVNPDDFDSNTTKGTNLDLLADWRYSEQTGVNARLSYTRQTNSRSEIQDFSGLTGALKATYVPTAKLTFEAELARDAGTNAGFFNNVGTPGSTPLGLTQNSQTSDSASLGVRYAATAKINANAIYRYRHAKILNTQTGAASSEQTDKLNTVGLGVTYDILRSVQLGCTYAHESRDVTGTATIAAFAYKANVFGCSAQFLLK